MSQLLLRGDIVLQGKSDLCNASFILDASKNWNLAPQAIKNSSSISMAKKEIKKFVITLPIQYAFNLITCNLNPMQFPL